MAQRLAQELSVTIEFVPFTFDSLSSQMKADHFDVAMSGVYGTIEQSGNMRFSDPYLYATMALVVPDHRDTDFATSGAIRGLERARVGIHRSLAGEDFIKSAMIGYTNVEFVVLDSYRDFFEQSVEI